MPSKSARPDIVDNLSTNMVDALNLYVPSIKSLDVSSGYFELSGYGLVRETLEPASQRNGFALRLLLGQDAISAPVLDTFEDYRKNVNAGIRTLGEALDEEDLTQENLNLTSSLVELLRRQNVQVRHNDRRFNHAKCYILGNEMALIGSSNFTLSGFMGNRELNSAIYQPASLEKVDEWFERMWGEAKDTKQEMIDLLERSKFGVPPDPYQVYVKMLFERYKPELIAMSQTDSSRLAKLAKFQKDAVINATRIIGEYGGVIIADSTGLGKTHMGIEIIRQKRHTDDKKVLLIAPSQVLETVWKTRLESAGINIKMISMERLGREEFESELHRYKNIDVVVIDESQNFRSRNANRRINLMKLMSGRRKEAVLLSATPVNNSIMDLYYQTLIIAGGDDAHFSRIGIPDLYRHMTKAAKEGIGTGLQKIQQLLDAVMIKRTRSFIKDVYPDEKIDGKPVKFPKRQYAPIRYDVTEATGTDVYSELLDTIESLHMVPYGIETYNKTASEGEKVKHKALSTLQTILILKRFESSTHAAKKSIDNKIRLYEHFERTLAEDAIVSVRDLNRIMAKWRRQSDGEDAEEDADEFFVDEIKKLPTEPARNYDTDLMKIHVAEDLEILRTYQKGVEEILPFDKKFDAVAEQIMRDGALKKEGKKVLIFTEYTATANHLKKKLDEKFSSNKTLLITGNVDKKSRQNLLREFSPISNRSEDEDDPEETADILVSTEVLAEGQNLQDCNYVINYDLPWNPMRIVQRIGRVDRLTSVYDTVRSRECYPAANLEKLLKLQGKLLEKMKTIGETVGIDTSILGVEPSPRVFNHSADRIRALATGSAAAPGIMTSLERESDMMPAISPFNEINQYVKKIAIDEMMKIPMGRRSGKKDEKNIVIVCYIQEEPQRQFHSVLYDCSKEEASVIENSDAFKMASCSEDTPKYMPMDADDYGKSFAELLRIDVKAREAIICKKGMDADAADMMRRTMTPYKKSIEKIQEIIMKAVGDGEVPKEDGTAAFEMVDSPDLRAWERDIADMLKEYERTEKPVALVEKIIGIGKRIGVQKKPEEAPVETEDTSLVLVGAMFITSEKIKELRGS